MFDKAVFPEADRIAEMSRVLPERRRKHMAKRMERFRESARGNAPMNR